MYNFHVNERGWSDIGQNITLFPDGTWGIGRDFNKTPVSISGRNTGAFAMEMVGNFDIGNDEFTGEQEESAMIFINFFMQFHRLEDDNIRFHNQHSDKTCPGTSINREEFIKNIHLNGEVNMNDRVSIKIKSSNKLIDDLEKKTIEKVSLYLEPHDILDDIDISDDTNTKYYIYCGYNLEFGMWTSKYRNDVLKAQRAVNDTKIVKVTEDGMYGVEMKNAVSKIQKENYMRETGILDSITARVINLKIAKIKDSENNEVIEDEQSSYLSNILRKGDTGTQVGLLQTCLKNKGYHIDIDESYGNLTQACVKAFQSDNNIESSGEFNLETLEMLKKNPVMKYQEFQYDKQTTVIKINKKYSSGIVYNTRGLKTLNSTIKAIINEGFRCPKLIINGGLFNMKTGEDLNHTKGSGEGETGNYYDDEGIVVRSDGKTYFDILKDDDEFHLGGSPTLLWNGIRRTYYKNLPMKDGLVTGKHPRTAVGEDDNYIYIVIVRGRNSLRKWYGLTLYQLTNLFIDLGCKNAMNLDGGGSTGALRANLTWIHRSYRAVANVLGFYVD